MALCRAMLLCSCNPMAVSCRSTTGSCSQMKVGHSDFLQRWEKNTLEEPTEGSQTTRKQRADRNMINFYQHTWKFLQTGIPGSFCNHYVLFCFVLFCILDEPQIHQVDFELLSLLSLLPEC